MWIDAPFLLSNWFHLSWLHDQLLPWHNNSPPLESWQNDCTLLDSWLNDSAPLESWKNDCILIDSWLNDFAPRESDGMTTPFLILDWMIPLLWRKDCPLFLFLTEWLNWTYFESLFNDCTCLEAWHNNFSCLDRKLIQVSLVFPGLIHCFCSWLIGISILNGCCQLSLVLSPSVGS